MTSRGNKYRQLVESRWDPVAKQSRIHVIRHLGKVVERDGKEEVITPETRFSTVDMAYPVGNMALYWKIVQEFGVKESVAGVAGNDTADAVILLALNQLTGRRALTKISSWVSRSPLHRWSGLDAGMLTKDYFLSALDSLSTADMDAVSSSAASIQHNIADSWKGIAGDDKGRIFYQDVTRIMWNGDNNYWAENGYGSSIGRPHIGFGLLVSKDHFFPIAGYPVRGSRPDKTTVREVVDNLRRWDVGNMTLVWDRGFVSRENVDYALSNGFHVLSGGPKTSGDVLDMIVKYGDGEIERRENVMELSDHAIYFREDVGILFGKKCRIVVMLDPERRNRERVERDLLISELEREKSGDRISGLVSGLSPIVRPSRGRKGYAIDEDEENRVRRMDGRSLLFCTNTRMSGSDIIRTYFQKDRIEKAFRHLKGDASLGPVRYQLPGRIEAYLSVVNFVAYYAIAAIMWKMENAGIGMGYDELIEKLSEVNEVALTSRGSRIYRWTELSSEMRDVMKSLDILSLKT